MDADLKQVFNGTEKFELNRKEKTMQLNVYPSASSFANISVFYNSIITIRNILPLLIGDKDASKTMADTNVYNQPCYVVSINIGKRRIVNMGNGFDEMQTNYQFVYKLIISKKDDLPLEVIQGNDHNNDFIKTSFHNIRIHPAPLPETSWYYSTYIPEYTIVQEKRDTISLLQKGNQAPEWKLKIINTNQMLSLHELKGNVVLIDFWIKNCGPCIQSIPHLNELQKKLKGKNFKLVSINSYDSEKDVKWLYDQFKINYTVLLNGKETAAKYGVSAYPVIFILNKKGQVIYSQAGYNETMLQEIKKVLQSELNK